MGLTLRSQVLSAPLLHPRDPADANPWSQWVSNTGKLEGPQLLPPPGVGMTRSCARPENESPCFSLCEPEVSLLMPSTVCVLTEPARLSLRAAFKKQLGGFLHSQRAVFTAAPPHPHRAVSAGSRAAGRAGEEDGKYRTAEVTAEPSVCCQLPTPRTDGPVSCSLHPVPSHDAHGATELVRPRVEWTSESPRTRVMEPDSAQSTLGPRRRLPFWTERRPLLVPSERFSLPGILHLDRLIVLFWNWCIS